MIRTNKFKQCNLGSFIGSIWYDLKAFLTLVDFNCMQNLTNLYNEILHSWFQQTWPTLPHLQFLSFLFFVLFRSKARVLQHVLQMFSIYLSMWGLLQNYIIFIIPTTMHGNWCILISVQLFQRMLNTLCFTCF